MRGGWSRPSAVAALYLAAAVVMTWPLAAELPSRIAGDLGDPLFNCWVLLWTSGQVLRALHGDMSALAHYWTGNIYYPAPLTLAYSEHLTPQMLQALPVLAATHNAVLAYNLLVVSTIVLSGLGMYLLVRELTGRPLAALLAGFAFAFAPYRIDQWAHLEVISSQWMPFALYGLRRFFVTGRWRPLAGGAAALVVQGLSCAYYLAYFTPFAVAYCLYELASRGLWRDRRTWTALVGAGVASLCVVALFLWPYLLVRRVGDVGTRGLAEIEHYSADTQAFATVAHNDRLWGSIVNALPHDEGQGFTGFGVLVFAAIGVAAAVRRAASREGARATPVSRWRVAAACVLGVVLLVSLVLVARLFITGVGTLSIAGITMRLRYRPGRLALQFGVLIGALCVVSPLFRRIARGTRQSPVAFFGWAALLSAWLSMGPTMRANGRPIGPGVYDVLYRFVPGFDGLRVPSLYFMILACFLAVLAGLGAAAILSRPTVTRRSVVVAAMLAILAEGWSAPVDANVPLPRPAPDLVQATALLDGATPGPLYQRVASLPADAVLVEFPFGALAYEIQYTFYAGYHRKAILNGYSGFAPLTYRRLIARLSDPVKDARAWPAMIDSGATHAIVHEGAYVEDRGMAVSDWLRRSGAVEIATFGRDRVFQLRPR